MDIIVIGKVIFPVLHPMWMNNAYHPSAFGHVILARGMFAALDLRIPKARFAICSIREGMDDSLRPDSMPYIDRVSMN